MKHWTKILTTVMVLFTVTVGHAKVFVPSDNGFIEKEVVVEVRSINNICKSLGYNSQQFQTYTDYSKKGGEINAVIFKMFSETIICVFTTDETKSLSKKKVNDYLTAFSYNKEYDAYSVESTLKDGIANKSLTSAFFEDVFSTETIDQNGSFLASMIGYQLQFKDGVLSGFTTSDGLGKWAKYLKENNNDVFKLYEKAASKYWKDNTEKVLNEINVQADALANTPQAGKNEYVSFHTNPDGTINFKMLMVAHYSEPMTLSEFKDLNFGRYELVNEFNDADGYKRTTYKVNKAMFTFDRNGNLVNSFTSN